MKNSNVVCNSCGYPLNHGRKYCKVCGNNLRENKKVNIQILKPSSIVALVFLGAALILGIIGVIGQVDQWIVDGAQYNVYGTTGVQWFFFDGWRNIMDSKSVEVLINNSVQFGFEFATYIFALVGIILLLIIYIQSLVRRALCKHTNFCTMKFFKFYALFTLPYVFAIAFFRSFLYVGSWDDSIVWLGTIGWGVLLLVIGNVIGFIASCIAHIDCPHKKDEKAPFALKQVGIATAIVFVVLGFAAGFSVTQKFSDNTCYLYNESIYWFITQFVSDPSIPLEVGASFISTAAICGVSLVAAIAFIMTNNKSRRIGYGAGMFALSLSGLIVNYFATISYIKTVYPDTNFENLSIISPVFIIATIFAFASLVLSIVYASIAFKKTNKKVVKQ